MASLLIVRPVGKASRWYVDGKRVTETEYDMALTNKTLDCFQTITYKNGTIRHYVQAR